MKKILLSFCMLLGIVGNMQAADKFSVDNVTLPSNSEADVVVRFTLDAGNTCAGYNFWLQIPEGLEFVTNGTKIAYIAGDCYPEEGTPSITTNLTEGYLKVAYLNTAGEVLTKNTGILVTFKIKPSGTPAVNTVFNCKLISGSIAPSNGTSHNVDDASFTVTIGEAADLRTILDENSTTAPAAATGVDVRVKRTIKANEWSTICLPFAMSETQCKAAFGNDVQLGDFTGCETTKEGDNVVGLKINFSNATEIAANHPYIIKVSSAINYNNGFTVDGVNITPEDGPCKEFDNGKTGRQRVVYSGIYGSYLAETALEEFSLFLYNNNFWYSEGSTKMKAYRAYFYFYDVLSEVENPASRIVMNISDEATGIKSVNGSGKDDRYFDLQGRRVKPLKDGLYIQGGKKVMIKSNN